MIWSMTEWNSLYNSCTRLDLIIILNALAFIPYCLLYHAHQFASPRLSLRDCYKRTKREDNFSMLEKKLYNTKNWCWKRERERERDLSPSPSQDRIFPLSKIWILLDYGEKADKSNTNKFMDKKKLWTAYSCLLKPGFPPIRSIRPHVHAPISPSVIFSYKGPFINDVTQGGGWGCKAKCEIMA